MNLLLGSVMGAVAALTVGLLAAADKAPNWSAEDDGHIVGLLAVVAGALGFIVGSFAFWWAIGAWAVLITARAVLRMIGAGFVRLHGWLVRRWL